MTPTGFEPALSRIAALRQRLNQLGHDVTVATDASRLGNGAYKPCYKLLSPQATLTVEPARPAGNSEHKTSKQHS